MVRAEIVKGRGERNPAQNQSKKLGLAALEAELDDPGSLRARVFARIRQMIEARRSHSAFSPYAAQIIPDAPPDLFLITRRASDGKEVLCATNVTANAVSFPLAAPTAEWKPLPGFPEVSADKTIFLPPYGVAWLEGR